jgi:hypothetical protein
MQALHKPTQGEVVSWHLIVQALQYDGGWNKRLRVGRRSQDQKGSPDTMCTWCRKARGGGPPFLVTLSQQRFLQNRAEQ